MIRLFSFCIALVTLSPAALAEFASPVHLPELGLVDVRGRVWQADDFREDSILVVAFLGTECPLATQYAARLSEIAEEYDDRSLAVLGVMSNRQDSLLEISAFARRLEIDYPILKDAGNRFADRVGAERTPEVFVYDQKRRLRYRGRVDDQFGIGYLRDAPRRQDLRVALDELLSGGEVTVARTPATGCIIGRSKEVDDSSGVTYGGEVAEILRRRCVECHRDGEIAPFSLTDYDEVAGWADMIAEVVDDERMPPWHADTKHAKFKNDRRLSDEEKETLRQWAAAGAPAGDLSGLPPIPKKIEGWQLPREPEEEFFISEKPIEIQATGQVRYQYFRVPTEFKEDVWFEAAELKPGNHKVVHHILAFAVPKGSRRIEAQRSFLVGYVPGMRIEPVRDGYAKRIPAGSDLIFQVHYTPIGTKTTDQSSLGLCLVDREKVTHEIVTSSAYQSRLNIRPNDSNYERQAIGEEFPEGATLLTMNPHMHLRGKSFRYELGGKTILNIPRYDFNWQTNYILEEPIRVEAGSRIRCEAVFDNSETNLANPDPSSSVSWGDQTDDEMMIGYYHYAVPIGKNGDSARESRARAMRRNAIPVAIFDRIDGDGDGEIKRRDCPERFLSAFQEMDTNRDDVLTRDEVVFSR